MHQLIEGGHVYVAQPPLFRIKTKKETYYVQTEEEWKSQLLARGQEDAVLDRKDGMRIDGENMNKLCRTLSSMEDAILALERRGINLKTHAERMHVESGRLPIYHVFVGRNEHWFTNRKELDDFLKQHEERN